MPSASALDVVAEAPDIPCFVKQFFENLMRSILYLGLVSIGVSDILVGTPLNE